MKKYFPIIVIMVIVLLVGTSLRGKEGVPVHPDNCFFGFVYQRLNGQNVPVHGATVSLYFSGVPMETAQTNDQGEYWFCRPLGGWTPGNYRIVIGCCKREVSRAGDGNIQVDFFVPCPCFSTPIPGEPADLPSEPIGEP